MKTQHIVLIVLLAVLVVVFFCYYRKGSSSSTTPQSHPSYPNPPPPRVQENFTALSAGAIDNVGSLLDDSYQLLPGADNDVPAKHFADLVDQGDLPAEMQPKRQNEELKPMERLERIQGSDLMPRVSSHVTPFAVDVADPGPSKFMVNAPAAATALKSKYKDYSLASFVRGDIPIRYVPSVCLVSKTLQGVDDLRLDGLFTPAFGALYQRYTGREFKNLPTSVVGSGQASGYGGASSGVIMDGF